MKERKRERVQKREREKERTAGASNEARHETIRAAIYRRAHICVRKDSKSSFSRAAPRVRRFN